MKKTVLLLLVIASFCFGFTFRSIVSNHTNEKSVKKVTGIGGIFFKCKDPAKIKEWYNKHLGLNTDKYGTSFVWYQGADSTKKGFRGSLMGSPAAERGGCFSPATLSTQLS